MSGPRRIRPLRIGSVETPTNLLAAPVAGASDLGFRDDVRHFGSAGMLFAEMVSADQIGRASCRERV